MLSGIIFINRNGLRWCDALEAYRPHKTLYSRWKRWSEKGILTHGITPDKGLWLGVVLQQEVVNCVLELVDAGVAAPADALCDDLGKETFNQIHPRRAGWRAMQLEAAMFVQPAFTLGVLWVA